MESLLENASDIIASAAMNPLGIAALVIIISGCIALYWFRKQVSRLDTVWADGGYSGQPFMRWVMDSFRWIVWVVLRPEQTKGFVLLKKRWVVERTFGWFNWYRRLSKDYERQPASAEAMIYIAMIRLMVRRLA